jgi:hypothetical protein
MKNYLRTGQNVNYEIAHMSGDFLTQRKEDRRNGLEIRDNAETIRGDARYR